MDGDRVLIVSAHPLFRESIIRLLGDEVEVVGAVADWEEARAVIRQRRPHTVIVGHESAELKDTDLAPLLWLEMETLRVIYVTLAGNEMIVHDRRRITGATEADLLDACGDDGGRRALRHTTQDRPQTTVRLENDSGGEPPIGRRI